MPGNFSTPKISTDIKTAVTNLTNQLIQQQKERLVKQGTSALTDLINKNKKDATSITNASRFVAYECYSRLKSIFNLFLLQVINCDDTSK